MPNSYQKQRIETVKNTKTAIDQHNRTAKLQSEVQKEKDYIRGQLAEIKRREDHMEKFTRQLAETLNEREHLRQERDTLDQRFTGYMLNQEMSKLESRLSELDRLAMTLRQNINWAEKQIRVMRNNISDTQSSINNKERVLSGMDFGV